tara:strand:- start:1384 stop:2259 length:876 start_codon:yes stop_codon:yes gene_type:complete
MAIPILNSIDLKGQLRVDGGSADYGQIEVGGNSGGIIDLKAPYSDDYDLRIHASSSAHEITTASGSLLINTANSLAMTIESDNDVVIEGDLRVKGGELVLDSGGDIKFKTDITYGPLISTTDNGSMSLHFGGNNNQPFELYDHNTNGGAGVKKLKVNADGVNVCQSFSFQRQGSKSITHSSGVFAINFSDEANYYICTVVNESFVDHSISFSNISSNVGQSGTIIINNPNVVSTNFISWDSPALPSTAYTPGGSAITFGSGSQTIAVMTYFIATSTKVLINYVSGFASYPQ